MSSCPILNPSQSNGVMEMNTKTQIAIILFKVGLIIMVSGA
jgi:hypothetical protein